MTAASRLTWNHQVRIAFTHRHIHGYLATFFFRSPIQSSVGTYNRRIRFRAFNRNRNSNSIVCICVCSPSNIFRPLWNFMKRYRHCIFTSCSRVDVGSTLPLLRLFIFLSKLVCSLSLLSYYYRLYFGSSGTVLVCVYMAMAMAMVMVMVMVTFVWIHPISQRTQKHSFWFHMQLELWEVERIESNRMKKKSIQPTNHTHSIPPNP